MSSNYFPYFDPKLLELQAALVYLCISDPEFDRFISEYDNDTAHAFISLIGDYQLANPDHDFLSLSLSISIREMFWIPVHPAIYT